MGENWFLANLSKNLISLITPDSLSYAGEDNKYSIIEFQESEKISRRLIPGDIILIRTPGTIYSLFRKAVNVQYDHMAVFLGDDKVLHISPPKIRSLTANIFLMRRREPLILRPNISSDEQKLFVDELKNLLGQNYDHKSLFSLFGKKLFSNISQESGYNPFLKDPTFVYISNVLSNKEIRYLPKKNICTDVIFFTLAQVSPDFRKRLNSYLPNLDISYLGAFTPDDVLSLNRKTDFFSLVETYENDIKDSPRELPNSKTINERALELSDRMLKETKNFYSSLDNFARKASENSKIYKGVVEFLDKILTKIVLEKIVNLDIFNRKSKFSLKQTLWEIPFTRSSALQYLKLLYLMIKLWRLTKDRKKSFENKKEILKYFVEFFMILHQNNIIRDSKGWFEKNLRSRL